MPNIVKHLMVNEYVDRFGDVRVCVLVNYHGLSADDVTHVRTRLSQENLNMFVLKNSIARRAFDEAGKEELNRFLTQPAAIIYGEDEPIRLAKTVMDLKEGHERLDILGGLIDLEPLDSRKVEALSQLPTRDELLGQLARGMIGPVQNFARAMASPVQELAFGLKDLVSEEKEE